jgi:dTDP-4-dehydrorhamnose reductase
VKILLTGKNGQIGWELARTLAPFGEVNAFDRATLDLAVPDQIVAAMRSVRPDVVVNAAAYTAVDRAEAEPELAMRINGLAPGILAEETRRIGALLIHYSTDYVFDGTKSTPYVEADTPNPVNAYGKSKLEGERAIQASGCRHLIFRTSWVYGMRGKNFVLTILRLARERPELRVVDDQIGSPTWCRDVATATARVVQSPGPSALYHLASQGSTSWCGLAREILAQCRIPATVRPIPSEDYPTPAKRPANSVLSSATIAAHLHLSLPPWQIALSACLREADPFRSG